MNSKALESFLIPINKEIDKIKGIIANVFSYKKDNNCQLCAGCFEMQMRGINMTPRDVLTPADEIFKNDNWNQDKYGFGFIKNNGNFEELILKMLENLKSQGIKEIIGPIDYATWYQYRFQVDNFDLSFLPDINNSKEEVEVLKKYGFNEKYHYSSTLSTIDKNL